MIANVLSASRLAMVMPFALLISRGDRLSMRIAAVVFALAIITDLLDGPIARRTGSESSFGRALDHIADFLFVMSGLVAAAARGLLPWALPILVAIAFLQYVIDSIWGHGKRELRMSQLGRWNGVLYFVPIGGIILFGMGNDYLLAPTIWVARLLVITTVLSIVDRAVALLKSRRKARDSRDARR
ncbi:MAG: CDP-alcohol phosphatidyltransferase family protein [bacterium]|nr:CDP-alcohol phosphatidyltransferase family protein [bacterium]